MATYYVSNIGNDASLGTSQATAWRTLAKVNDTTFSAGDNILFRRGDTWSVATDTYLACYNNGTSLNRITYGAYGSGALPVLTARHTLAGWNTAGNWTNTSGNTWRYTYGAYGPGRLWINGTEAKNSFSTTVDSNFRWYWDESGAPYYLYVYSTSNPATAFSSMEEAGKVLGATTLVRADYVTLQNLNFQGGFLTVDCEVSDYLIFEDCSIGKDSCGQGLWIITCDNGIIRRCTFDSDHTIFNEAYDDQRSGDGLHLRDSAHTWDIHNNYFKNWGHAGFQPYVETTGANSITDILFHNNYLTAPDISYSKGIDVAGRYDQVDRIDIYNNLFYNSSNENQIAGRNVRFYNNVIDTITGLSYSIETNPGWGHGITIFGSSLQASNPVGIHIFNNTIINCKDGGIGIRDWGTSIKEDNFIRNNLIYNCDTDGGLTTNDHYQLMFDDNANIHQNTWQNNMLYYTGATDSSNLIYYGHDAANDYPKTVAEFNAANGTAGDVISGNLLGVAVNSMFVNYAGHDYHLKLGSPAIGAGRDVSLNFDYDGNVRTVSAPSIGAFEYTGESSTSIPTVTTASITNVSTGTATGGGNVTADGSANITDRGVCWNTSTNPTIANSHTHDSSGTGSFVSSLIGLNPATYYYVRAYATNSVGTGYGSNVNFTTDASGTSVIPYLFNLPNGKYLTYNGKYLFL
jgi:hypothetical protein